jgi:glycosyltransferase involved in cell wall biosynthesis
VFSEAVNSKLSIMTISIITVAYNSSSTIKDTIDSVLNQSYPNIEYIIIDGNSTDNTPDIVKSYGNKIACFISEKDKGIYDAMNKGLQIATGDIIGILNSDDVYATTDVLEKVAGCFASNNEAEICYGDLNYVQSKNLNVVTRIWKAGYSHAKSFHYGWMPPHPTIFVKKEVYQKVGLFNLQLKSASDYEMMLRMFVKHQCKAVYLPYLLVKMRAGGMSNASLKNRLKANREDGMAWKINGLKPYFFTTSVKPLRKISQFLSFKK